MICPLRECHLKQRNSIYPNCCLADIERLISLLFLVGSQHCVHKNVYEERQKILSERVEAMIKYSSATNNCREDHILHYFGEKRDGTCGRCDICRDKRKKAKNTRLEKEMLITRIIEFIKERPNGVDFRIISHNLNSSDDMVAEILSFLTAEGYLDLIDGAYKLAQD